MTQNFNAASPLGCRAYTIDGTARPLAPFKVAEHYFDGLRKAACQKNDESN
jgi:hypothetical protein